MLLEKPEPVTGIIDLHSMNSEGISQSVRAYSVYLTGLRVNQVCQPGSLSTFPHHLPGPVTIDSEDEHLTFSGYWAALPDVIPEHIKGTIVDR